MEPNTPTTPRSPVPAFEVRNAAPGERCLLQFDIYLPAIDVSIHARLIAGKRGPFLALPSRKYGDDWRDEVVLPRRLENAILAEAEDLAAAGVQKVTPPAQEREPGEEPVVESKPQQPPGAAENGGDHDAIPF